MTQTNQSSSFKAYAILGVLFLSVWGGCYYLMSGTECIRTIPDGAVRCECDFSSSTAFQTFKEEKHGAWEAVEMENDPCN